MLTLPAHEGQAVAYLTDRAGQPEVWGAVRAARNLITLMIYEEGDGERERERTSFLCDDYTSSLLLGSICLQQMLSPAGNNHKQHAGCPSTRLQLVQEGNVSLEQ